jgi:hypothetical protein
MKTVAEEEPILNREAWLTRLAHKLETEVFIVFALPPYRVSCGWPSRRRLVGECHSPLHSEAGVHELFISPALDDPLRIAAVLCHELAHVAAGVQNGHGFHFRTVCATVGLTNGRPRGIMPGAELKERLRRIVAGLPSYPHKRLALCV